MITAHDMMRGLFVTGTDTEIGKTRISAGLLHACGQFGLRVAGLKPVAAGLSTVDGRRCNDDVELLRRASNIALDASDVGPCQLEAACAPHIAASVEGRRIELPSLVDAAHQLAGRADWLVVEGVGGFRVPFDDTHDSADLAVALGLPVILVVGLRLGCLNHALLTADAIRTRGLTLAGWVANSVDPTMPYVAQNVATLRHWLEPAPCLGIIPWLEYPDPAAVSAHLAHDVLKTLIQPHRRETRR